MKYQNGFPGHDELRMQFTVWLKVVVKRAKIDYIRRQKRRYIEVPIESAEIAESLVYEQNFDVADECAVFDFENDRLAAAFAKLSPRRRQILVIQFVKKYTSEEIAKELNCSLQYIYGQRSVALKELRWLLIRSNSYEI